MIINLILAIAAVAFYFVALWLMWMALVIVCHVIHKRRENRKLEK